MIFDKDNIWIGLGIGLLIPFVGYALLLLLYEQLESVGVGSSTGFSPDFRQRTIAVIAICLNVFPVNRFRRRRMTDSMRGVVFATTAYVLLWVVYFANSLF